MAWFADFSLFFAKALTLVVAIAAVVAVIAAASRRQQSNETLRVEKLNKKYRDTSNRLRSAVSDPATRKLLKKQRKAQNKIDKKQVSEQPRTFVVDFKGDIRAQAVASLREEVSTILAVADEQDHVLVRLENPGGVVHEHGLAAAQLARVRDAGLHLTVAVDRVAASGGYLMACIANEIVAAPFAIVGSIGVIAQLPNFHRLLDDKGVEFEQITAGQYKRTVTMFGKNTDEDRAKLKSELEDIHKLFKDAVTRYRPTLDIDTVATGEHWYGTQALELGLIDSISTSDALLTAAYEARDVFTVNYEIRQPLQEKLMGAVDSTVGRLRDGMTQWWPGR
ncbi:MAG: protease SohB [Pseudomonadota bacterium]